MPIIPILIHYRSCQLALLVLIKLLSPPHLGVDGRSKDGDDRLRGGEDGEHLAQLLDVDGARNHGADGRSVARAQELHEATWMHHGETKSDT